MIENQSAMIHNQGLVIQHLSELNRGNTHGRQLVGDIAREIYLQNNPKAVQEVEVKAREPEILTPEEAELMREYDEGMKGTSANP